MLSKLELAYLLINEAQGFVLTPTQRMGVVFTLVANLEPADLRQGKDDLLRLVRDLKAEVGGEKTLPRQMAAAMVDCKCDRSVCGPCETGGCGCYTQLPGALAPVMVAEITMPMGAAYRRIGELADHFECKEEVHQAL